MIDPKLREAFEAQFNFQDQLVAKADGSGRVPLADALLSFIQSYAEEREKAARGKKWEFGVPVLHGNAALRDEFYHVVNDLREAGCIVDLWVNDIQKTLEKHGYRMEIFLPTQTNNPNSDENN